MKVIQPQIFSFHQKINTQFQKAKKELGLY
uniref:Uncharacterized protein n=1 Tax=Arundo donax TaxID=35708 RepID=A0A0A9G2L4_ARUDO